MSPLIHSLRSPRRPAAISWLVIAAWVNAVKRQIVGAVAHVGKEVRVTGAPSFTDGNALTSVPLVVALLRVVAAFVHASPRSVGAGEFAARSASVSSLWITGSACGDLNATARSRVSVAEIFAHLGRRGPAVTKADPIGASVGLVEIAAENDQLSEPLAGEIHRRNPVTHTQYFSMDVRTAPFASGVAA
jgi:hypothetical protein